METGERVKFKIIQDLCLLDRWKVIRDFESIWRNWDGSDGDMETLECYGILIGRTNIQNLAKYCVLVEEGDEDLGEELGEKKLKIYGVEDKYLGKFVIFLGKRAICSFIFRPEKREQRRLKKKKHSNKRT